MGKPDDDEVIIAYFQEVPSTPTPWSDADEKGFKDFLKLRGRSRRIQAFAPYYLACVLFNKTLGQVLEYARDMGYSFQSASLKPATKQAACRKRPARKSQVLKKRRRQ